MLTLIALYVTADVAMILLWSYFAYRRRPHNSVRTMLMFILGIVAIMLELFPDLELNGKPTAVYLLLAGTLHYFSVHRGTDVKCLLLHAVFILPVVIQPYIHVDSSYDKLVHSFRYRNEKSLSNILDISILPAFELDTVYEEPELSEPRLITARFKFQQPFDKELYQQNVLLLQQLYLRHMHRTQTSNGELVYLASESAETPNGRKYIASSVAFHSTGFTVTYGEYTDQIDPVNIHFLEQIIGPMPGYTSLYRYNNYSFTRIQGEEIILLDDRLMEDDFLRINISCADKDNWYSEQRNDTTFVTNVKHINRKTSQTTRFIFVPDQMGGCEAVHIQNLRETVTL